MAVAALQLKLEPNREDRPRFVTLVHYEQRWVPQGDGEEQLQVVPVRRTQEWLRCGGAEKFMTTRVTELPFRAIKPQQAHRELAAQWKAYVTATQKAGAPAGKPVTVQVVP